MSTEMEIAMATETFGTWTVDDDGLSEVRGYWINKSDLVLVDENGASRWIRQVLEKTWADPETFMPALKRAIERHTGPGDVNWDACVMAAQALAYAQICYEEAERRNPGAPDWRISEEAERLSSVGWYPVNAQRQKARAAHEEQARASRSDDDDWDEDDSST